MSTLRVVIVDDEELARDGASREYLADQPDVAVVAECANGFEAVKAVTELKPDLVLLDVQMPKLERVRGARADRPRSARWSSSPPTTSTRCGRSRCTRSTTCSSRSSASGCSRRSSARARTARRGTSRRRSQALRRRSAAPAPLERVLIRDGAHVHVLPVEQIDYVEAQDDYVSVQSGGEARTSRSRRWRDLEATLDPERFVRDPPLVPAERRPAGARRADAPREPRRRAQGRDDAAGQPNRVRKIEQLLGL